MNKKLSVWIFFDVILRICFACDSDNYSMHFSDEWFRDQNIEISHEKRLTKYLLWRYSITGRGGRPVVNTTSKTLVDFGLGLIQMDLDEREKILTTSMWSKLRWKDEYMTWNPSDFGNVTTVRLEADQVWLPDVMLYNTAEPDTAKRNALVLVLPDGTMQWVPHQIFRSSCSIDVKNFPFDQQVCNMWFGSWTHSHHDIDVNLAFPAGIDLSTFQSDYKDSCEWEILSPHAEKRLLPEEDPNPIAVITFTLTLRRKLVFSSYILTLPCVFLASLTLVVFWLPPDRPDRTGLAMSLFSSFLVLLLILVEAAPPTANSVPTIGVYYCFNMVIIMMSIFLSSMVVNLHRAWEDRKPVPKWIKLVVLDGIARILCMCTAHQQFSEKSVITRKNSRAHKLLTTTTTVCNGGPDQKSQHTIYHPVPEAYPGARLNTSNSAHAHLDSLLQHSGTGLNCFIGIKAPFKDNNNQYQQNNKIEKIERKYDELDIQLRVLKDALLSIVDSAKSKETTATEITVLRNEWKEIATILDRFFFVLYVVIIIISLISLFPRPLHWGVWGML